MKLLLVSDLHYALKQYDWTAAAASEFDAVVIAGDQIDISGHVDGSVQIVVILKYLKRLRQATQLIVASGNHDLDTRDEAGEKVARWMDQVRALGIPTDGDTVMLGDTLVTICPWWDGPRSREAVEAQLARDAERPKKSWLWVYHAPPEGSPTSWSGQRFYGDGDLLHWIKAYEPDLVFAGHIHQAPFCEGGSWADQIGRTWVFNCGQQMGPIPTHVVIDTQTGEAVWVSMDGAQRLALDRPMARPFAQLTTAPPWLEPRPQNPGPNPA